MGRGKVELKRIEDKVSRQVSFTKRRNGLMKKAHELSVLCDVDIALFAFSPGRDRLYEFSTNNRMTEILNRYQHYKHAEEAVLRNVRQEQTLQFRDADELTHMIQWHLNEHKVRHSNVTELCKLEKQTETILQQVRNKQKQLREEKQLVVGNDELLILELKI
ncbi:hypothetical protein R6Q59_027236 [Mikania micrantha]